MIPWCVGSTVIILVGSSPLIGIGDFVSLKEERPIRESNGKIGGFLIFCSNNMRAGQCSISMGEASYWLGSVEFMVNLLCARLDGD